MTCRIGISTSNIGALGDPHGGVRFNIFINFDHGNQDLSEFCYLFEL